MKARDLMVPVKTYLMPGDGLREFVEKIMIVSESEHACGARSLLVIDKEGNLVGTLSMRDILKAVHPSYLYINDLGLFTWDGMLESLAKHIIGKKVSDLMTKEVVSVKEDHPLMECVDQMLKHDISILPVTDHSGNLLGMLYESDLFFAVAGGLLRNT